MIAHPIPDSASDITVDWMRTALTAGGMPNLPPIRGIALEPAGPGAGIMSTVVRCRLTYADEGGNGPRSVVVKLPSTDRKSARMNRRHSLYRREYIYYSRLASASPIRGAELMYGDFREPDQRFVLVMEDLGEETTVDQVKGITVAETRSAIRAIARLHAHYWNEVDGPSRSGLPDDGDPKMRGLMQMAYLVYLPRAMKNFPHLFPDRTRRLAETFGTRLADYVADVAAGPRTFVHGDFRAANMFFGRRKTEGWDFAVVDWQICGIGSGLYDVACLLCSSLPTEARRQVEDEALREYHEIVCSHGVQGFSFEDCWRLYRQHVLGRLLIMVFVGGGLNLPAERSRHAFETSARRSIAAIEDLEADEFLPARRPRFSRANMFSTLSGGAYRAYRLLRR